MECRRLTVVWALLLLGLLFSTIGCGDSLPATVTGTITLDGSPLPSREGVTGNVVFYPTGGGAAAVGQVSGGKYSVTTGETRGLQPGDYKVTVRVVEIEPEPPGGYASAPPQKLLTPKVYSDKEKSDLTVTVEPGSNRLDLDLVSN